MELAQLHPPFAATGQDHALAKMLASLAEDESPASSQAACQLASQLTALEEQDSILSQASTEGREELGQGNKEDGEEEDRETLEMSQQVWDGDAGQGEGQQQPG